MAKKTTRTPRRSQDKFPGAGSSGGTGEPDDIKMEFARRLQKALWRNNWSQSEFARRCNAALPPAARGQKQHTTFRRDLVSHYITGQHLPSGPNLAIMAKVLDVEPSTLLPTSAFPEATRGPFAMTTLPDGRVFVQISQTVSPKTSLVIAAALQKDKQRAP